MEPALQRINDLTEQNYPIVYFDTLRSAHIVDLFKNLSLASSKAIYHWMPGTGMYRMDANHIMIPRTEHPEQLLTTINSMAHYGVFLLSSFHEALADRNNIEMLKRIASMQHVNPKMVILIGNDLNIPSDLRPSVAHIRHTMRPSGDRKAG